MEAGGGARVASNDLAIDLAELEIRRFFRLVPTGTGPGGAPRADDPETGSGTNAEAPGPRAGSVVVLSSGDPWLVTADAPAGPYTLLASPLDGESTSLPVSAAMIPLLEWAIERWSGTGGGSGSVTAGTSFVPPTAATSVRTPGGEEFAVDGDQPFLATTVAGFYQPVARDSLLPAVPVNPPAAETDLTPASPREVRRAIPGTTAIVDDAAAWSRSIFRAGRGPEPWRAIAAILLVLLLVETVVAAARGLPSRPSGGEDTTSPDRPGEREGRRHGRVGSNPAARV